PPVMPNRTTKLSLAAGEVSAGLLAVKARPLRGGLRPALTAPTPHGMRQLARNKEKTGQLQTAGLPASFAILKCRDILPGYPFGISQEETMARHFVLVDDL